MHWTFIAVGKPSLSWARSGAEDYLRRLQKIVRAECLFLRAGSQAQVTRQMLEASEGSLRILLDESGVERRSVELAGWIEKQELHGCKRATLLIGGADGHAPGLKSQANECWSLSAMTLQHELALVIALEQVYRAYSIMRGDPYHRE